MRRANLSPRGSRNLVAGLTLLELVLACGILLILSSAALPVARMTVQRRREAELRRDLRELRDAIDRYKDAADKNLIRTEVGSQGYPPDLQTLVDGVSITLGGNTGNAGGISASALAGASNTGQFGSVGTTQQSQGTPAASALDMPSKVRFLRKVPADPMTGKADWGLRAVQDDPDSRSWSGHNVFDVYTMSDATAIDGTKYSDW